MPLRNNNGRTKLRPARPFQFRFPPAFGTIPQKDRFAFRAAGAFAAKLLEEYVVAEGMTVDNLNKDSSKRQGY